MESKMTHDLPPPDLKDNSGRLKRLALALLLGAVAGTLGYVIADRLAQPDAMIAAGKAPESVGGAIDFVSYVAAFAGGAVFVLALRIQNKLADRKYRANLLPRAEAR
jgi:hypothetical protein